MEELPWDSAHFGFPVARFRRGDPSAADLDQGLRDCRDLGIRCVYLLCDAEATASVNAAAVRSFQVVDQRVTLDTALGRPGPSAANRVRQADGGDRSALVPLARTAFAASRFFLDGRFPREKVESLFERWVERDLASQGGVVVVFEEEGRIAGFASGTAEPPEAAIGLVAVSPGLRGRGVGRAVVTGLLARFARAGATRATVVTQGRSTGAIRLYESVGFRVLSIRTWLHRWLDRDPV